MPETTALTEAQVDEYEKRRYAAVRSYHSGDDVNWFLTVAIPALIRDWRAMKAENSTLKKHWADTSEDLASALLKHEEYEQTNAALRERLAQAAKNHVPSPEQLRQVADAIVDMLINHQFDDGDGLRGLDPRGLETTPDLIATILINFHNYLRSKEDQDRKPEK